MIINLQYESETIIPDELEWALDSCFHKVQENRLEPDKVHIDLSHLRAEILQWLVKNRVRS